MGNETSLESENHHTLEVYPDPFNEMLIIDFSAHKHQTIAELRIFNLMGQIMYQAILKLEPKDSKKVIRFDKKLSTGMYLIEFVSDSHKEIRKIYKSAK